MRGTEERLHVSLWPNTSASDYSSFPFSFVQMSLFSDIFLDMKPQVLHMDYFAFEYLLATW